MNFKKFISGVSAFAIAASAFAAMTITASAATGDTVYDYSLADLIDITTGDATTEYATDKPYYDSTNARLVFNPSAKGTVTINFKQAVDISGGENGDDVAITFNLKYTGNTYTNGNNNTRRMYFRYNNDGSQTNTLPFVSNKNWGAIWFGSESANQVGSVSTGGTDYTINIYSKDGKRYAKMVSGTASSAEYEVTGTYINQIYLTTGSGINQGVNRLIYVDNLNIKSTEAASEFYKATFVANNGTIQPTITVYSDSAKTTLADADMLVPGTYYYTATLRGYADITDGTFTVTDSDVEEAVTMTALASAGALTVKYAIKNSDPVEYIAADDTPSVSGYYAGESYTYTFPKYINHNGTLYQTDGVRSGNGVRFSNEATLSSAASTANVEYSASNIDNVVYYTEGEKIKGVSTTTGGNIPTRSSNAACAYLSDYDSVVITTLTPGKYQIKGQIYAQSSAGAHLLFSLGSNEISFDASTSGNTIAAGSDTEYTITENTDLVFLKSGSSGAALDYIYVVKTGDLPATATLNSVDDIYEFTQGTEDAVTAAVLNVTVADGTARVAVSYNESDAQTTATAFSGPAIIGVIVSGTNLGLTTGNFAVTAVE